MRAPPWVAGKVPHRCHGHRHVPASLAAAVPYQHPTSPGTFSSLSRAHSRMAKATENSRESPLLPPCLEHACHCCLRHNLLFGKIVFLVFAYSINQFLFAIPSVVE
jgi:hypothetical protein